MTDLERDFHLLMVNIYKQAKEEVNYTASRFIKMVDDKGGLAAAKHLLSQPMVSDGFVRLFEANRLDLSVEAQILANSRYWSLFSDRELDTARRWLKENGYVIAI